MFAWEKINPGEGYIHDFRFTGFNAMNNFRVYFPPFQGSRERHHKDCTAQNPRSDIARQPPAGSSDSGCAGRPSTCAANDRSRSFHPDADPIHPLFLYTLLPHHAGWNRMWIHIICVISIVVFLLIFTTTELNYPPCSFILKVLETSQSSYCLIFFLESQFSRYFVVA